MRIKIALTMFWLLPLAALVIAAGCKGGGGGGGGPAGPSANAPVVSNLQIRGLTAEKAFREVQYAITATVTDPNNDLIGGRAEVKRPATGETVSATITADTFIGPDTIGLVLVINPVPAGRYDLVFAVTDAAGNRSNEIAFFITIQPQVPLREVPQGSTPSKLIDRLTPAR